MLGAAARSGGRGNPFVLPRDDAAREGGRMRAITDAEIRAPFVNASRKAEQDAWRAMRGTALRKRARHVLDLVMGTA